MCRACARLAGLSLILGAGLLIYLQVLGVPDWAKDRWVAGLASRDVHVDANRITFSLFHGLAAHGFHFYDTSHRALPMMEAEYVELEIDALAWLSGRSAWTGLDVRDAIVRVSTQGTLAHASPDGVLAIQLHWGILRFHPDRIEVTDLRASIPGLEIIGHGHILLDAERAEPLPRTGGPWTLADGPDWLTGLIRQLNEIDVDPAPEVSVTFDIDTKDLSASDIRLEGDGEQISVRGVDFDSWLLKAVYKDRMVFVEKLHAVTSDGDATIKGSFDVDRAMIAGNVSSELPPTHWTSLIPISWRDRLDAARVVLDGGAAVRFDIDVEPVPLATFWTQCGGTVVVERVELRDVWIEQSRFVFATNNETLEVADVDAIVGRDSHGGAVTGQLAFDWSDRSFRGRLESDMDYVALIPVLGDSWIRLIRSSRFHDQPPHVIADFSGRIGDREAFVLDGTFEASDFQYRETFVNHLTTDILSSNRVLTLSKLKGEREEGNVDGRIQIDFRERRVDLGLTSHADPKAMGRVATKRLERIFRPFTFNGSTDVDVEGSVHLSTNGVTDIRASATSTLLGLRSFVADTVSLDLVWTGRHVNITNIAATIYGGTLGGSFGVYPAANDQGLRYALDMHAAGVQFPDVVRTLAHKEGEEYRGRLEGNLQLTGNLGPDQGRSATGHGEIRIDDGRIMMIPLFGPLSRGLSSILPGLGFTKQTDLTAAFDIADLHIQSDDMRLLGAMFSLDAVGIYSIEDTGLDFDVEMVLLGDGLVGEVVQFVTAPITKLLLEFDLEGTLGAPQWRPKNLPRELFVDPP